MEVSARNGLQDFNLASRKAEEAAFRRFQAAKWLMSLVGPLGMSEKPSEMEFISCLRNGQVLCNAVNKIKPGAVTKVVEIHQPLQSLSRESQPLSAYQYFENVRNFLVVIEELKIPAFEASDLERDSLEAASAAKVVDCVLALKSYHEWKLRNDGNGFYKNVRSPVVTNFVDMVHSQTPAVCESQPCVSSGTKQLEDAIVKGLVDCMVYSKENIDNNRLAFIRSGKTDSVKLFGKMMSNCFEECLQNKFVKCCRACLRKGNCNHRRLFQMQEKELVDLKDLLSRTKRDFEDLQSQLERDLNDLGNRVQEMSTAARGYQRVVNENRNLYNMVQDLKGNIRVYCRIRPSLSVETRNVIDFIEEDGSLVILDPSKPLKDGRKHFQFNRVFGPTATQGEVFNDTQPLMRSVMDGYNACIFAYGQTGSGKTHTMSGPSGINYLALNDLFEMSCRRKDDVNYEIHVQMVEIYDEEVRDLLGENSSTAKVEIPRCTNDDDLALLDATMHCVKSTDDVLNLMKLGEANRVFSSNAINRPSSRSHNVLTVHVHGKDTYGSISRSCLHLVELAGSERVDESEVVEDRLKEAHSINKSLSCLGDVMTALARKSSRVPYRNSKLTLLLQDSLGGHAKTLMIVHISPEDDSFGETVNTLKFAQRVSTVELGVPHPSKKPSSEAILLKKQVESLKSLKKALENKEADARTPPVTRRSSLENLSSVKRGSSVKQSVHLNKTREPTTPCAVIVKTPPISRRSSMENVQLNKTREPRTPCSLNAKTPQRTRRSSIQNEEVNLDNRKNPKTPILTANADRKVGSQIKKSLQTIGKLITGSEKRNRVKSAVSENARAEAITNIHPKSRRSSLGGKKPDLYANDGRLPKTPPSVNSSTKATKRWL